VAGDRSSEDAAAAAASTVPAAGPPPNVRATSAAGQTDGGVDRPGEGGSGVAGDGSWHERAAAALRASVPAALTRPARPKHLITEPGTGYRLEA
jgi:hypothetical protein